MLFSVPKPTHHYRYNDDRKKCIETIDHWTISEYDAFILIENKNEIGYMGRWKVKLKPVK